MYIEDKKIMQQPTELELRKKTMTVTPHNIFHGP